MGVLPSFTLQGGDFIGTARADMLDGGARLTFQ